MRPVSLLFALWTLVTSSAWSTTPAERCDALPDDEFPPCSLSTGPSASFCPGVMDIGRIPCKLSGTTCGASNTVTEYAGSSCTAEGFEFPGEDVVFRIHLNDSVNVGFNLDLDGSRGDLLLILAGECETGANPACLLNSPDFIGPGAGPEAIPATAYESGDYFLYIDSFLSAAEDDNGSCGEYCLTVTAPNPPELELELTADGRPEIVIGAASRELRHELLVRNPSSVGATALRLHVESSEVGSPSFDPGPHSFDETGGVWSVDALAPGGEAMLTVTYTLGTTVEDDTEIRSTTRLDAVAEPFVGDTMTSVTTRVRRVVVLPQEAHLTLEVHGPQEVVAGDAPYPGPGNLVYEIEVHNGGEVDASEVVVGVDLTLPEGVRPDPVGRGSFNAETGRWRVGSLPAGRTASLEIPLSVGPSAAEGDAVVGLEARVRQLAEPHPDPLPTAEVTTSIRRRVNLGLEQGTTPAEVVAAGFGEDGAANLTFTASVTNDGPSDASGLILSSSLERPPTGIVTFKGCDGGDEGTCTYHGASVTWRISELRRDETAQLRLILRVGPSVPDGAMIAHELAVESAAEENVTAVPSVSVVSVTVAAETDLVLGMSVAPEVPLAGDNLVYTLELINNGPSDSTGATVCLDLDDALDFISSSNSCHRVNGGTPCAGGGADCCEGYDVLCRVGAISDDDEEELSIVTDVVSPSEGPEIVSMSRVFPNETDPDLANNEASASSEGTAIDLAVDITPPDREMVNRGMARYEVTATNRSMFPADEILLRNTLIGFPRGRAADAACGPALDEMEPNTCGCFECRDERGDCARQECIDDPKRCVECSLPIEEGLVGSFTCEFTVRSIGNCSRFLDLAEVTSSHLDPDPENNTAGLLTFLYRTSDVDLEVTQTVFPDPALANQPLSYILTVANRRPPGLPPAGPEKRARDVELVDTLPAGVTVTGEPEECTDSAGVVTCDLGMLEAEAETSVVITVLVDADAEGPLVNVATVEDLMPLPSTMDPDSNNESRMETSVLDAAPLVAPRFVVDRGDLRGETSLFSLRNLATDTVSVRHELFDSRGGMLRDEPESLALAGGQVHSLDLGALDLPGDANGMVAGYVDVRPDSPSSLSGELFRVDPENGLAHGNTLVDRTLPPGLCNGFSTGFFNGDLFEETDFVFFVPGEDESVVVGRVYNPDGRFVHEVEITTEEVSFEKSSSRDGLELLARSGTVEWTFRDGMVGHVTAVFRSDGLFAAAVPGFCTDPGPSLGEAVPHLILPYFDVGSDGTTTVFSVRNPSATGATVRYEVFDAFGEELCVRESALGARAAYTVDLAELDSLFEECPAEVDTGHVAVTVLDGEGMLSPSPVLYGEAVRIDTERDLASGARLLDPRRPALGPPPLCSRWNARLLNGGAFAGGTEFLFYAESPVKSVSGQVHDETGAPVGELREFPWDPERQVFRVSSADLPPFGFVEWTFADGVVGHVSTVFTAAGGFAAAVPAVCLDSE